MFFTAFCMVATRLAMTVTTVMLHVLTAARWHARLMQRGGDCAEKMPVEASTEAHRKQLNRMQERDA